MNDRERAANQDLQMLGDAYRLGQIAREEYRARRRQVLAGLRHGNTVTARKPLLAASADTVRSPNWQRPPTSAASPSPAMSAYQPTGSGGGVLKIGLLVLIVVLAAVGVWLGLLRKI